MKDNEHGTKVTTGDPEFDAVSVVKLESAEDVLLGVRRMLQVPEGFSILTWADQRMRRLQHLEKRIRDWAGSSWPGKVYRCDQCIPCESCTREEESGESNKRR